MKGNQGLEALAALCGGRQKAVDMAGAPTAAAPGATPSTPPRTSPQTTVAPSAGVKSPTPVAATANQLLMRQASERSASDASNLANAIAAQKQQATAGAPAPISMDPNAAALGGLTPQQISQAIMAAANSQGGRLDPALAQSLLYPAAFRGAAGGVEAVAAPAPVPTVATSTNNLLANTMQQLILQQYLQAQANAQQQQVQQQAQAQATAAAAATNGQQQAALFAMTLAAGKAGQLIPTAAPAPLAVTSNTTGGPSDLQRSNSQNQQQQQQAQQVAQAQALLQQHAAQQQQQQQLAAIKPAKTGMQQHPQAIQQQFHFQNGAAPTANLPSMMKIAAAGGRILPSTDLLPQNAIGAKNSTSAVTSSTGNKKQQKRAANRRSAQLSRKRKKQFIEELKDENDDLRRKEQILRAIPDLIVVFDSSGRLGFVSESVGRFLDIEPEKLEGTSFWTLICDESVRMLKAAFMDSLAAREVDCDTATLGSGVWELRLKDKNNKYMIVTLNGVVHFNCDAPECVCCIRPLGEEQQYKKQQEKQRQSKKQKTDELDDGNGANKKNVNRPVSCSDGDASRSSTGSNRTLQSVLKGLHVGDSMSEQDEAAIDAKKRNKKFRRLSSGDGDSSSGSSSNNNNVEADGTNNSVRISDGDSNDGIESD
eukprot:CAMPEP_0116100368 /NCGR_PEP_ID=MMETSP0327-20121206/12255_1 /TAXON_ID=44447 /ORGANISM="Pseudo-nitzschia delicatissima, Strain B596" /LENGTH=651 /DNA_ID=CAMNT_0003592289 /DNA_START=246 /DNA_END=2201 /DNA_ORIENTATION=-